MSTLYQQSAPTFGHGEANFPADYEAVAEIDSDDPDVVFQITNVWPDDEPRLRLFKRCRSTSVGDIVLTTDHHLHLCLPLGWKDLGQYNGQAIPVPGNLYEGLSNE